MMEIMDCGFRNGDCGKCFEVWSLKFGILGFWIWDFKSWALGFKKFCSLFIVSLFIASFSSPIPDTPSPASISTRTASPSSNVPTLTPVPLGKFSGWIASYRFNITLDYVAHRASIIQTVEVTNPGPDAWTQVVFQLPTALRSADTWALSNIMLAEGNATYQKKNGLLIVNLPKRTPANGAATITFNYALIAPKITLDTRPPSGNIGYSNDLIQFINWYPILTPYRSGSGWLMLGDAATDPLPADPIFTDAADYEMNVTTTEPVTVTSGVAMSRSGGNWKFNIRNARTVAFAASHKYQSQTQREGNITFTSYYLPEHVEAGQDALKAAAQSLKIFNDRFGAYPYTTLIIAENAYLGSATASGIILHTGRGYADYVGRPDSLLIALTPQAMSRLWWGQAVMGDSYSQPWLNESTPMYSELLFYQTHYPNLESWYWDSRVNYWQPRGNLDRAASQFGDTEDYSRNLLRRGALFLRDLRAAIGDTSFFGFLRDFYSNSTGRTVSNSDFFVALRRHTNADLNPLLAKYFAKQIMPTVAPTLTAQGSPSPTPITHVVMSGETLGGIAKFYGVTVEAIVKANKLPNADAIFVGQRLVIPK